jgi:hypothetical protein
MPTTGYHLDVMYHVHDKHGFPLGQFPAFAQGETWDLLHDQYHDRGDADHTHVKGEK